MTDDESVPARSLRDTPHTMVAPPAPAPVSPRHTLRWRLPLLITCLIALVLAAFLWVAYRRVESSLAQTAGERAQRAADLVAGLLDGRQTSLQLQQVSADPRLREFLETRTAAARAAAQARLAALTVAGRRRIELWDSAGARLLEVAAESEKEQPVPPLPPFTSWPPTAGAGRLEAAGGLAFTDTLGIIRRPGVTGAPQSSDVLGYIRIRSTFTENPPGILARLLGREAVVRVANREGDVWTDFTKVVPPAPVDLSRAGVSEYRDPDGRVHLGAAALINATPLAAWVEFPRDDVVAPAGAFLAGMIPITLTFVVVAALLAAVLASRITTPLTDISTAAETLARGDYSQRVTATRRDEIGRLGRTFNAMASEIEAATAALRKSEDGYRRLFANNPHPMWVYDMETLRFVDVNDMAIAHYGYSRDEFLAMTIADIRPAADLPKLRDNLASASPVVEMSGVWRHRRRDGSIIDVDVSSHAVRLDGRPARAVLAHDVTARLKAQRALEESERMLSALNVELEHRVEARTAQLEAANQELEAFSYSVSHDLRAPLRHVQGYVEMVTVATRGQLSEKVQRYLATISEATVEMGQLIDDLLAFSRMARVQMSEGRVILDHLVQETIEGLEMVTRDRHITWNVSALPSVTGDPSLLKQVYVNLLHNAVKYSRDRDPARIEIGSAGQEDGQWVLYVRDNGAGFDMQYAHKLFGVFQRLHRSDEFEGTGIGLATVKRIVTRHGGRIWAEGQVDAGATIYFTLPAAGIAES